MPDDTRALEAPAPSAEVGRLLRLLQATVDTFTGCEWSHFDPTLLAGAREAASALMALQPDADPEPMDAALTALEELVASLPPLGAPVASGAGR
jgi:hypothetical protein